MKKKWGKDEKRPENVCPSLGAFAKFRKSPTNKVTSLCCNACYRAFGVLAFWKVPRLGQFVPLLRATW